MVTALIVTIGFRVTEPFAGSSPVIFAKTALATAAITTVVWVIVTFLTSPEPDALLLKFYREVRPHVTGWKPIAARAPEVPPTRDLGRNLLSWVLGCAMIYLALFGSGYLLMGNTGKGLLLVVLSLACAGALYANLAKSGWQTAEQ